MKKIAAALALLLALGSGALAAERYPVVIKSGQQQQLQAGDKLLTRPPSTATASIRLPHGTAPTSPADGDLWTTTAGLYARINGGTVGPLGPGAVTSVFGRTGAVAAALNDYAFNQISGQIATTQIPNTAVTAGSYTNTNITVDAQGRITAAANGSGGGTGCVPGGSAGQELTSDGAGACTANANLTNDGTVVGVTKALALSGDLTPTALSGDVNNYNPTNLANALRIRQDGGAADRNITGLAGGAAGRIITLVNVGTTNNLTLVNNSPSSSAGNKFLLPADVILPPNTGLALQFDPTSNVWRPWSRALANTGVTPGSYTNASITVDSAGRLTAAANGSSSGVSVTAAGNNIVVNPSPGTGTFTIGSTAPDRTVTSGTIAAGDMGGQVNATTGITISAISSTVNAAGMSEIITAPGGSVVITSSPTINGIGGTTLHKFGFVATTSNGTSLDGFGFPGFDTITTNALPKFVDSSGATTASTIVDNGGVVINAATGGAQGAGTINAHGLFIDGVAVGAGTGCTVSGAAGLVFNNGSSACVTDADLTFATHTVTVGASGIFDFSAASVTGGLKIPAGAGAAPTADAFVAFDTTAHDLVWGSNGSTAKGAALNLVQTFTKAQRGTPVTITISTLTFTPDFDSGNNFALVLAHSASNVLANPSTTLVPGQSGMFAITQSSSGSDAIGTWGSDYFYVGGTSAITLSTGASVTDYIPYYVFDTSHIILGGIVKGPTH